MAEQPEPPGGASPFASPEYGRDAERGGHVIASRPAVRLEENQGSLTGWAGAGTVIFLGTVLAVAPKDPSLPAEWFSAESLPRAQALLDRVYALRHPISLLTVFMAMILTEMLVYKTHRRQFDFENPRAVDGEAWERIWLRWIATAFCLAAAAFAYFFFLGEYSFWDFDLSAVFEGRRDSHLFSFFYGRYAVLFVILAPLLLLICIPYYWLVERHARPNGPVDEFLVLGRCLQRLSRWLQEGFFSPALRADAWSAFRNPHLPNMARGLLVKFFYVPLMLLWSLDSWRDWEMVVRTFQEHPQVNWADMTQVAAAARAFHHLALTMIFMLDLNCALAGYCVSMRLLDNQITTAEPTLLGWIAALACYPPFNNRITDLYFYYGSQTRHGMVWEDRLWDHPHLTIFASLLILGLMAVYSWATLAFGLRFSNLTNRGIISGGPYRFVRHPAYICKNTAWWIEFMPFLDPNPVRAAVLCFHLLAVNGIYALRAYTEEKHLMREEHYREYCRKVPWRFIPGIF
ncbi:MAG: isoprenylcysteine carboxylmethyltransferase family protein [Planctomycetota bacterium]|nr:isoprenylcysteine carboxylmethyltransferase family protein [Planctomycetota bacterium]